jgi:transcriptional coactivator HFI1/ADA1
LTNATETWIKEVIAMVLSRTRSNGPGESGSAGFGGANSWFQTNKYKRQLIKEEDAALRGEVTRDKSGLLPIEAKAANERGPLGMADLRIALEMGDCGLSNFPAVRAAVLSSYHEGELEHWEDYTWVPGHEPRGRVTEMEPASAIPASAITELPNGHSDEMELDPDSWWDGADPQDQNSLDAALDACLAVGS